MSVVEVEMEWWWRRSGGGVGVVVGSGELRDPTQCQSLGFQPRISHGPVAEREF